MMHVHALIGLGSLGFVSSDFGGGGHAPIVAEVGARALGDFMSPVVYSPSAEPAAPAGIKIPIHKDSDFPFVTINPDDGTDKGGGWQEANANLEFIKIRDIPPSVTKWKCPVAIGMPLRTETMGKIPPSLAATMSAGITNMVTIGMDFELPRVSSATGLSKA